MPSFQELTWRSRIGLNTVGESMLGLEASEGVGEEKAKRGERSSGTRKKGTHSAGCRANDTQAIK